MSNTKAIEALQQLTRRHDLDANSEDEVLLHRILDALKQQREGWVLVPVEPTFAMARAGGFAWENPPFPLRYKAMLDAAPKPEDT